MKAQKRILLVISLLLLTCSVHADIGFTQRDLELVKGACLAGNSFEFSTEADGSISVKNLEGRGRLHVTNKSVDTVDLPDSDKKQEFNDIRSCIKEYLFRNQTNRGDHINRAKQFGDQNDLNQINRGGQTGYGNQSNELYQSGNGNKASQINQ